MSSAGKGDDRRPRQVSREEFESNWDRIFEGELEGYEDVLVHPGSLPEEGDDAAERC